MTSESLHSVEKLYLERDAIRWLMHDQKKANRSMAEVFEHGLTTKDWEMQLTCMIACAYFGLKNFAPLIQKTTFFYKSKSINNRKFNPVLLTLQKVICAYLSSKMKPLRSKPATMENIEQYMLHCILRNKIDKASDLSLFINSIMIPNGIRPIEPHMPAAIRLKDHKYYLKDSKIEFVHIPPFKHWIGSEQLPENPLKHTVVKSGFFISKFPLSAKPITKPYGNDYLRVDFNEMKDLVRFLSKKYNTKLIVPSVFASEMASRGQTGRLFPWGNQLEDRAYNKSPWSMAEAFGSEEWWTSTSFDTENNYTYGSWKQENCGGRVTAPHMFKRSVRIAIKGVLTN